MEGFVMVLLAAFIGGIRWTLTQLLMQKAELGQSGGSIKTVAFNLKREELSLMTALLLSLSLSGLQNPIDAMYHLQPLMFLGLFPLFLYNEGESSFQTSSLRRSSCE